MKLTARLTRQIRGAVSSCAPGLRSEGGLPASQSPQETLLRQLRRDIKKIQRRVERLASHPVPAPKSSAFSAGIDSAGIERTSRHDVAPGHRFGRAVLERPGPTLLAQMVHLTRLTGERWCPEDGPLDARQLLFLDLETTGLSRSTGTIPFLIGAGRWSAAPDEGFQVHQIFLSDPGEEPAALESLRDLLRDARVLVTFNGRGFDLPLLRNRALINRTPLHLDDKAHLDLLPLCRRLFRSRTTDCRLVTLERERLGFMREGDVDGAEVPGIYNAWLHSGRPGRLPLVMEHNRLDVALMAPLLLDVTRHVMEPLLWAEDGEELLGTARIHLDLPGGLPHLGEACLRRGLELARLPATRRALLVALARHLRRGKRPHEAGECWEQLRREFPRQDLGWIELAKYHEHTTRDLARALWLTEQCPAPQRPEEIDVRLRRLRRRLRRRS